MKHHKKVLILASILIAVLFLVFFATTGFSSSFYVKNNQSIPKLSDAGSPKSSTLLNDADEATLKEYHDGSQEPESKIDSQITNPVLCNDFPDYLEIPSIGVNAKIEHLGLTKEGNMDMTNSTKNVAWYELGPRPGDVGSAVIGGHYGYPDSAVFHNLTNLKKGDIIYVKGCNGEIKKFVVRETRTYQATDIVREVFFSDDELVHLNLVTCNGKWIDSLQTYNKRFVVFTDLIY